MITGFETEIESVGTETTTEAPIEAPIEESAPELPIEPVPPPPDPLTVASEQCELARLRLERYREHVAEIAETGANTWIEAGELVRRERVYQDACLALEAAIEETARVAAEAATGGES